MTPPPFIVSALTAAARNRLVSLWAMERRFLRFLAVGALNAAFGYGVFCAVFAFTGHSLAAVTISTIAGVLFNFRSTGVIVFGSSDSRLLTRFIAVYALLFVVNALALRALEALGAGAIFAQAGLTPLLAVLSYVLNRDFVFAKHKSAEAAR